MISLPMMTILHEKFRFETRVSEKDCSHVRIMHLIPKVKFKFGLKDGRENKAASGFTSVLTYKRF